MRDYNAGRQSFQSTAGEGLNAIGRTEVTRAQFAEFVEETGFTTMKGCSHLTDWGWQMQPEFSWRDNSIGDSDDHPAPCLRRAEILAYLELSCRTWVIKGGSWAGFPGLLRVATRLPIFATTAGSGFGFRVARNVD